MRQIHLILARVIGIGFHRTIHTDGDRGRIDARVAQGEVVEELDVSSALQEGCDLLTDGLHGLREVGDVIFVTSAVSAENHVNGGAFSEQIDQVNVTRTILIFVLISIDVLSGVDDRIDAQGLIAFDALKGRKD